MARALVIPVVIRSLRQVVLTLYAQWQINSVTLTYDAQVVLVSLVISLVMRVVM